MFTTEEKRIILTLVKWADSQLKPRDEQGLKEQEILSNIISKLVNHAV